MAGIRAAESRRSNAQWYEPCALLGWGKSVASFTVPLRMALLSVHYNFQGHWEILQLWSIRESPLQAVSTPTTPWMGYIVSCPPSWASQGFYRPNTAYSDPRFLHSVLQVPGVQRAALSARPRQQRSTAKGKSNSRPPGTYLNPPVSSADTVASRRILVACMANTRAAMSVFLTLWQQL